ncbi:MAG: hypothetical protein AB8G26_08530 [Ilumatobacter sp.]
MPQPPLDLPLAAQRRRRRTLSGLVAAASIGTALIAIPSSSTGAVAAQEMVVNPSFDDALDGWRTSGHGRFIEAIDDNGVSAIKLTTSRRQNILLYTEKRPISDAGPQGSVYDVEARVRTTTPGINGALRLREVAPGKSKTHRFRFSLNDTEWTTVSLRIETARAGATLDPSVAAWNLENDQDLLVDILSVTTTAAGDDDPTPPTTAPPTTAPPTTAPPTTAAPVNDDACDAPVPSGTTFGTSISAVGQSAQESLRQNDARFGEIGVVRDFFPGRPAGWNSSRMKIHADRDVVVSFKLTPQSILSGQHDTYLKNWFNTAPRDRVVYWAYHHEPEGEVKNGEFTPAQYRRAWERLDRFADAACKPNMHATLILSAWTSRPQANPTYTAYDAGPDVIDVLAFDPYNRIFDPRGTVYDSPEKIFGPINDVRVAENRPVGVAELGTRKVVGDTNGAKRAQWLRDMGAYAIEHEFAFVAYFQSTRGADWRLLDTRSVNAWKALVAGNPR